MQPDECFLCRKHRRLEAAPPGGYIHEDAHWLVCHAPIDKGPLGTLFIEARRHVLDFAEFSDDEARTFAELTRRIYAALRPLVQAERIYQLSMMEGIPHFHAWIVPRTIESRERGVAFLAQDLTCSLESAAALARSLSNALR